MNDRWKIRTTLSNYDTFFENDKDKICVFNLYMLRIMSVVYLAFVLCYFASGFITHFDNTRLFISLSAIVVQSLFVSFIHMYAKNCKKPSSNVVIYSCYFFGFILLTYAGILDLAVYNKYNSILFSLTLILMGQIYTLPMRRTLFFMTISGVIFCISAYFVYNIEMARLNLLNIVSALIIGTTSYFALMVLKASEYSTKAKLEHLSMIDQMTDTLNKTVFSKLAQHELDTMRDGTFGALVVIDMDGFKFVNDRYGHFVGDDILICFAKIGKEICERVPNKTFFGRFGGDEFMLFVCDITSKENIVNTIRSYLVQISNDVSHRFNFNITFSGGAVTDKQSFKYEQLFSRADRALLLSKQISKRGLSFV